MPAPGSRPSDSAAESLIASPLVRFVAVMVAAAGLVAPLTACVGFFAAIVLTYQSPDDIIFVLPLASALAGIVGGILMVCVVMAWGPVRRWVYAGIEEV